MKVSINENDIKKMVKKAVNKCLNEMYGETNDPNEFRPIIIANILKKHPEFGGDEEKAWEHYKSIHMKKREGITDGERDKSAEKRIAQRNAEKDKRIRKTDEHNQDRPRRKDIMDMALKSVCEDYPYGAESFSQNSNLKDSGFYVIAYKEGPYNPEMFNEVMRETEEKDTKYKEFCAEHGVELKEYECILEYGSKALTFHVNPSRVTSIYVNSTMAGRNIEKEIDEKYKPHVIGAAVVKVKKDCPFYDFHFILDEEGQRMWEEDDKKLIDDVNRFYAGSNYWGD